MSVIINPPINAVCFLSELRRIEIIVPGVESVDVSLYKTSLPRDVLVFSNNYVKDEFGKVVVYDLDKLIEPYIDPADFGSTQFSLVVGPDEETAYFKAIPCSADVSESAADFVPDFFLTPMMGERDTCVGRRETVTPFLDENSECTVYASYFDGSTVRARQFSRSIGYGCRPIDVSPSLYVDDELGELISYSVQCGKRKARYRVLPSMPAADPAIIFRNCFGAWETIYLTGLKTQQPKYTRSSAIVNGQYKVYDIVEEMAWEAYTGPLRESMVAIANDLARSKAVYLLNADGTLGDEIVITDSDTKVSNADDELPEMKFTFRRAAHRAGVISAVRPPRLFDSHFDSHFA